MSILEMAGTLAEQTDKAAADSSSVAAAAESGVADGGGAFPFASRIQASFGRHDISGLRAHQGESAISAAEAIGANAYTTGSDVAFGTTPDLHTAAHEAAHFISQRGGVHPAGGVGEAADHHESHANAVADLVVRGESAEDLLTAHAGSAQTGGAQKRSVQRQSGTETHTPGTGTEYTVDAYRQDLTMTINFLFDYHRSALSQVQSTLGREEFGAADAYPHSPGIYRAPPRRVT
ncbi:MAG: DUF4157 domain-containing protein [Deltaproteobacteria bacterium]|nr:MAG: DUF4157 domain-containing protein [Deltaproteobacteria bacterium]